MRSAKASNRQLKFALDSDGELVQLPLSTLMQTVFFGGYKGSGKTTAMKKLFEASHEAGAQCVAVAPLGKWWSLRIAKNGKGKGLRGVVVFGGSYGDVPIQPSTGRTIAHLVHTKKLHAVLDVELMRKDDRAVFLTDFFEELMMLRKKDRGGAMVVFLDETQAVAPQKSSGKEVERLRVLLGDFARECRNFGCGLVMSAQRSASVDKELIALCDMLVVMRTVHHLDRKVYKAWVDEKGSGGDEEEGAWLRKLRRLSKGEAYLYAPELNLFQRVSVLMTKTFDATATATIGARVAKVGSLSKIDVKRLGAELSAVVEAATANDPATLKNKIRELELKLASKTVSSVVLGAAVMGAAKVKALKPDLRTEKRITKQARIGGVLANKIEALISKLQRAGFDFNEGAKKLRPETRDSEKVRKFGERYNTDPKKLFEQIKLPPIPKREHPLEAHGAAKFARFKAQGAAQAQADRETDPLSQRGPRAILIAVAQAYPAEGVKREALTVITGYKRSTRDAYVLRLAQAGYTLENEAGEVVMTDAGRAALGDDYKPLPTGAALREHWANTLPEGEAKIFKLLVESYPQTIVRERISELSGYKLSTRNAYIARLEKRQLVVEGPSGDPLASPTLFQGDNS